MKTEKHKKAEQLPTAERSVMGAKTESQLIPMEKEATQTVKKDADTIKENETEEPGMATNFMKKL